MQTLNKIKAGGSVTVKNINANGAFKRRLLDMGITQGVVISVKRVAPFGDPIEITVRGYNLFLRKSDAEMIEVI